MPFLSDKTVGRLRGAGALPDFSGTRYTLIEFIARGGMGAVYLARDEVLGRRVALKVLDRSDSDGGMGARLGREARVLAELEHPGIVPVHDAGTLGDGTAFYAMKFVEGARLDQFLAGAPPLPERLRLVLRVSEAVSFAHSRGILHRDLKPSNVMVGAFGEVLVMDWGLAKVLRERQSPQPEIRKEETAATAAPVDSESNRDTEAPSTRDGTVLGTPGYMSPEQARGSSAALDARSDIFSLGRLLHYVLTEPRDPGGKTVPRALAAICRKASAEDPSDRYGAVREFADDLSNYLDGLAVSAHRENLWERARRFYGRYQAAILLITAYLVMRALLLLYPRR
jgi:eukaryotic-like serine/threonine-protein kinase